MKVFKERKVVEAVEIGDLDAAFLLPSEARVKIGLNMKCKACGEKITDSQFAGGTKGGEPNLVLHIVCVPKGTKWIVTKFKKGAQ